MTTLTIFILFLEMTASLWLALYLLPRGYTSGATRHAVIILLALSAAAFLSYVNLFLPLSGVGAWWAAFLTIALVAWYDLTYQFLPPARQRTLRWARRGVFAYGAVKTILLVWFRHNFPGEAGTSAWVVPGHATPLALIDAAGMAFTAVSLLYNFRLALQTGSAPNIRSLWIACLLGAASMGAGATALLASQPTLRLPLDALLTAAVAVLGFSIARHQAFILRRALLRELPITGLTVLALMGL